MLVALGWNLLGDTMRDILDPKTRRSIEFKVKKAKKGGMRAMPEPILEVRDLTVHFYTYAGIVKAIEKVSFDVYRGETFAIVGGETGCGKSVTSRALTQLIESPGKIVGGSVIYHREDGTTVDLLKLSPEEIREIRGGKEIAYIFQDPHASLDPLYTVAIRSPRHGGPQDREGLEGGSQKGRGHTQARPHP